MIRRLQFFVLGCCWAIGFGAAADDLQQLDHCTYIPASWADGDSFLVRGPDGKEFTLRLYAVDCIEWHVKDTSDARRLQEQRRWFGIAGGEADSRSSIALARSQGEAAGKAVARWLQQQPFTVHTAFADARGDGKHKRVYGYITLSSGRDLGAELVRAGLARSFGVRRARPDGESADDYRERLDDLQLLAAKAGRGVWRYTQWEKLADERALRRKEEREWELAIETQRNAVVGKINPNTAARDVLMRLPGIGEVMANRIIESRPITDEQALLQVPGIGRATLAKLRPFLEWD